MARWLWPWVLVLAGLAGCLDVPATEGEAGTVAAFDPAPVSPDPEHPILPRVPQPSDLLRDPVSGQVTIPVETSLALKGGGTVTVKNFASDTVAELVVSHLNGLEGFATTVVTASTALGGAILDASVTPDTAFVLDITALSDPAAAGGEVTVVEGAVAVVGAPEETPGGFATPLSFPPPPEGWRQGRTYAMVLTTGILDAAGRPLRAAWTFNLLKSTAPLARKGQSVCALPDEAAVQLEAFRGALAPVFEHLETAGVGGQPLPREDIAQLWTLTVRPGAIARYDLVAQVFPTPNDLLLTGPASPVFDCDGDGAADCLPGHLCFPVDCAAGFDNASNSFFAYMNGLDGWPASLSPAVPFTLAIDPATVHADTARIHDLETGELLAGTATSWDPGGLTLTLRPATVQAGGRYAVVVGRGIRNADGRHAIAADDIMGILKLTRPLVDGLGHSLLTELGLAGGEPAAEDALAGLLEGLRAQTDGLLKALALDGARADVAAIFGYGIHTANEALFDPQGGLLPWPNDLLMTLDEDGAPLHVALPVPEDPVAAALAVELNMLDGFSPLGTARTRFLRDLDSAGFRLLADPMELLDPDLGGSTAALVGLHPDVDLTSGELDLVTLVVQGRLVVLGADRAELGFEDGHLVVRPRPGSPLLPGWRYVVAVLDGTRSLEDGLDGEPWPVRISPIFFLARSPYPLYDPQTDESLVPALLDPPDAALLEQLRTAYDLFFSALEAGAGLDRERILLFWTFTTQRVTSWAAGLHASLAGLTVPGEVTATLASPASLGYGDLGSVALLALDGRFGGFTALIPPDRSAPGGPAPSRLDLDGDGVPRWSPTEIPFAVAVPEGAGPFRVALLLHGFGGSRADFLALAEPFAAAGWVLLAADLPFHGARAPEGLESGAGFLSAHPASLRDNLVAAALDQVQVLRFASSPAGLASLLPGVTLDTGGVAVVGESLGGLVAAILAGIDPAVETLALAGAGGHLARILAETPDPALAATLQEALAARGLTAGTPEAARFLEEVQMLLDRGDPVNYAAEYGLREPPPRLLLVTAGDGTGDGTIPAGAALELACAARGDGQPWTFHVEGSCGGDPQGACHGFLLHPETAPAAAAAATEAILAFFAAGGLPDPDAGLSPADALDCPDGT